MSNESKLSDAQKLGKAKEILETRLSPIHAAFDSMIGELRATDVSSEELELDCVAIWHIALPRPSLAVNKIRAVVASGDWSIKVSR